jgi:hypothetical protein
MQVVTELTWDGVATLIEAGFVNFMQIANYGSESFGPMKVQTFGSIFLAKKL